MQPFTVVSLWGDWKQAEVDSIHRLSRSDTRRKSFRHNFSHMIWIQTGKGLSSKHPNWLFIFFKMVYIAPAARLLWLTWWRMRSSQYSFLEIVQQLSEGREIKSRRGQYVKLIQGARITRRSLYREQRGWYLIFLSPSWHEIQVHI